jgi:hypothetical protein
MNSRHDQLVALVSAVNRAHSEAGRLYSVMAAALKPMIGQVILKADGTLMAKVQKMLPELPYTRDVMTCLRTSNYNLWLTVKTCEGIGDTSGPHTCLYHETSVYLANLRDRTLLSLMAHDECRTDYTVEEVMSLRQKCAEAKKAYEAARSACYPFGE